ncbi:hypothetical protein PN36_17345 [Candidatus Thiomargarita nelsonii]|uniref:Uncharacterized protein n=1 Tax=Candidatus Thiomargarita nelsonii TaxID=1003181 RepID=A0A0A6RVN7_9GAMM|nr:hypothetical protein PN36_17345 [Candidatus Thiomargarita nelsonii]
MAHIQLIVTGDLEKLALALNRVTVFTQANINFIKPQYKMESFTSGDVSKIPPKPQRKDGNIDKLAAALVAEINLSQPPDMVIVIDDLEIANFHQPELVASGFHDAVDWYIQNYNWASQRTRQTRIERLRERCSFHLLVPMVEAYFFGEVPDALNRAGAVLQSSVSGMDVENFAVKNDHDYLKAPKGTSFWAKNPNDRVQHPKRYLDYLCCSDVNLNRASRYRETKGGVKALEKINWDSILLDNSPYLAYLRSLFDDISNRFNLTNPYPGVCAPVTDCGTGISNILRNI